MSHCLAATVALRRRLRLNAIAVAVLVSTGCSSLQPYETLHPRDKTPGAEGMPVMRLAGDAEEALADAERLRHAYYRNLAERSTVRNATGALAGVLSGWVVYNAVRPGEDAGAAAALRRSLRLGAVLGTLYGFRELFMNPAQESIYAEGYRAMTCLMLQSAPLLMSEAHPSVHAMATPPLHWKAAKRPLPPYQVAGGGDMDLLRYALDELERRILEVHEAVATTRATADAAARGNADLENAQTPLRRQFKDVDQALRDARTALSDGRTLARTIEGSGRTVRERTVLIAGLVNQQLQAAQNGFKEAADRLKDAQGISDSVMALGAATAADQAGQADGAPTSLRNGGLVLAGPMSAIGDLLARPADLAPQVELVAAAAPKKKAAVAPAAAASTPLSLEELKTYRDAVDAAIKSAQERADKAKLAQHENEMQQREKAVEKNAYERVQLTANAMQSLAEAMERLYAARRPVVQELQNFRRRTREAANTAECRDLAPLRVSPNDVQRAYAGYTVSYLVSQREAGTNPMIVLQGPQGTEATQIKFDKQAIDGTKLHRVELKIGAELEKQTVKLVVTDGRGVATQELLIVAGGTPYGVLPPKKPAAAASGAK